MRVALLTALAVSALPVQGRAQSFVNFEHPHVHPLDTTPDRTKLVAVNTPDNRLEVFTLNANGVPVWTGSVPVGLDPVSVRARSNNEVWVVNHLSDSISIVDLTTMNVVRSLRTKDEPADVVFAGTSGDAFVTCSQANVVQVWSQANLAAPAAEIPIAGEDPRAMGVSPDGSTVYVAVFESGNASTILAGSSPFGLAGPVVAIPGIGSPYNGKTPPPNDGGFGFIPPSFPGNPFPPEVGVIVRKNAAGLWVDDNGADWTSFVTGADAHYSSRITGWDLPDRDVFMINANTRAITGSATGLLNMVMALGVNPATGHVSVVGTDAINHIRFEPNVNGKFVRVNVGTFDPANPAATRVVKDMNDHLTYASHTIPMGQRLRSIGDPRAIVWNAAGTLGYVAGLGSNNVILIDADGDRQPIPSSATDSIPIGEGPTGLVLDEGRGLLYAMNKFASTISVIDTTTLTQTTSTPFYDPSPEAIKAGRKHLYDTHKTSGLGQASCASCHVDARTDRLSWDLGAPDQEFVHGAIMDQNLGANRPDLGFDAVEGTQLAFLDWHPMKGPFLTQTLQDIIGQEPLHWRGDRDGIEEFNGAFVGLLGDDELLTPAEMQEFEDFLATIHFPPNPYRNFDNSLATNIPLPGHYTIGRWSPPGQPLPNGNAVEGMDIFINEPIAVGRSCVECHTLPTGMGTPYTWNDQTSTWDTIPPGPNGEARRMLTSADGVTNRTFKVPNMRNMYERGGMNFQSTQSTAGFGFFPDGAIDTLEKFIGSSPVQVNSDQEVADLTAFVLSISGSDLPDPGLTNLHFPPGGTSKDARASVGWQTTITGAPTPEQSTLINAMLSEANQLRVGLVVKGVLSGEQRGFTYVGLMASDPDAGDFRSDRSGLTFSPAQLQVLAGAGSELTWTVVPYGSETRIGIDRDEDTYFDRDEIDAGSDPADPDSVPPPPGCPGDANGDNMINAADLSVLLAQFGTSVAPGNGADFNNDGLVNSADLSVLLGSFGTGC